jgi:hypothetical protein
MKLADSNTCIFPVCIHAQTYGIFLVCMRAQTYGCRLDDLMKWGIEETRDENMENCYVYEGMKFKEGKNRLCVHVPSQKHFM